MIHVEELVKDFGNVRAVDHISFDVAEGEIVGFLGPNGAGKSTTIRVLTGYHAANSGKVLVHGMDVLTKSLEVRSGLGYLPENVPIYPDLRVEEYLRFRASMKGVHGKVRKRHVEDCMAQAGVTEVRRKLVAMLSRGYRQRVGIADALLSNPPLLVLDEATSGLDPNQRRRVREFISGLKGKHTILFSSHLLSDVEDICDRIILIHEGKLRADGSIDALRAELGSRELTLRIKMAEEQVPALLEGLPFKNDVAVVREEDGFLHILATMAEVEGAGGVFAAESRVLDAVNARIQERKLAVREIHLRRLTLEEIFYQLTRSSEEGAAQEHPAGEVA